MYDNWPIPFGKHKFTALCRLPASYLLGLNKKVLEDHPEIKSYIEANAERLKAGNGINRHNVPEITLPCQKKVYLTEKQAREELEMITAQPGTKGKTKPIRYYYCKKCSAWHLTSKVLLT